ncbi:MAG TPA: helix-turn-helix transcriptional regulator [Thermoanaerobaculia bacterium]|nr:helix-turn-helix transcriptional regulator [Thermoanaerobaculia bacterium]
MEAKREFGVRLTRLRKKAGLSITQLAQLTNIGYMQISRYEKGITFPSLDSAVRLAIVLRITVDQLARDVEPVEPIFRNTRLLDRMRELDRIPADRQEMALRVLDTVIAGYELEGLSDRLRRG